MIQVTNLCKRYGNFQAVSDIGFHVKAGELFGFLGPNGAGKTTTIKMMVGLLKPSSGMAVIGGYDMQKEPLKAKAILGYVPDQPNLYEKLTGFEYLKFIADIYQLPREKKNKKINDLLEIFELADRSGDLIQGYSHGMRQKIALAGALIHDPKVIFLDEPTVGLDPKSARMIKDILHEICHRGGTVFMSTHILEIAEKMCDRVAIVDRGQLKAIGTVEELRGQAKESSLEDIFLQITGGREDADIIRYLDDEEDRT